LTADQAAFRARCELLNAPDIRVIWPGDLLTRSAVASSLTKSQ
jgi:hypothetical protein